MKTRITKLTIGMILWLFAWNSQAQFDASDFLKANGTVLRNNSGTGDTINLRGTNLGSWLSMEYWMGPLGKGSLDRSQWVASAYKTEVGTNPQNVFDRDLTTHWSNGEGQRRNKNQYFMVDMQENVLFNRVSFEAGTHTGEYPASYEIEVSEDGTNWELVSSGSGNTENIFVQLPNIYYKRYVRINQTGMDPGSDWSIAEFNLFMEDDFRIRNSLILRYGEDGMDALLDEFQNAWITTKDLDSIQAMGMNMVRVPFYWMEIMYNDGSIKPHGFDQLDWIISECSQREMYVILDLHGAPGGLNGFITSGQAYFNELWTDAGYQQMTIDIWKALAARYKDNPTVAMYDLMNEPLSSDQDTYPIHAFYNTLYQEVRAIDPDHLISIGAFPTFSFVVSPDYYGWTNVIYQVHHYNEDKTNFASQNGFIDAVITEVANHQNNWNVPILAGEFNFWDFPDLWAKYLRGLNALNVSWSNWSYKTKRVDSPKENWGYYDENTNPSPDIHYDSYDSIAAKWSRFETSEFRVNQELKDIVTPHTTTAVSKAPIGQVIWLQGSNGLYVSSEGNSNPMTCNRSSYDGWELFEVVDTGNGKIALRGSNGFYVSSENGQNPMICDKTAIGEWEQFTFIQLGVGRVALKGNNGKYVSSEDGVIPMNCNRDAIGGWEIFNWGNPAGGRQINQSTMNTLTEVALYPNPANDFLSIRTEMEDYSVTVFDTAGTIRMFLPHQRGSFELATSNLNAGLYFFKIASDNQITFRKILINN
ncbi:cellulase family glycosylhydrolase [Reichenbachiella ulvae]|uniref:Cellulase family glycosylhydrolase n=1 Tax=Reichenbachiella ulvae TaxID=2980104 RepID=A0ABT3CUM9_9BACT|nr:cellulase family glycosylhydrolase [Reichenbachiella ulvae]MCV9387402.1 cellulase family glycosylhydrolase [Reichenbachiella ulvae]